MRAVDSAVDKLWNYFEKFGFNIDKGELYCMLQQEFTLQVSLNVDKSSKTIFEKITDGIIEYYEEYLNETNFPEYLENYNPIFRNFVAMNTPARVWATLLAWEEEEYL